MVAKLREPAADPAHVKFRYCPIAKFTIVVTSSNTIVVLASFCYVRKKQYLNCREDGGDASPIEIERPLIEIERPPSRFERS